MPDTPRIFSRVEWDAEHGVGTLDPGPEGRVVIHHSYRPALSPDATVEDEVAAVYGIERHHTSPPRNWDGIGYNFLAAPSGRIYEGRGWHHRGAHSGPVNGDSIGICLLINGSEDEPTIAMINAVRSLIGYGVQLGEIAGDYTLSGHRDHMARVCPGDLVYRQLDTFRHDARPDLPEPDVDVAWIEGPLERPVLTPVEALLAAPEDAAAPGENTRDLIGRVLPAAVELLGPVASRMWGAFVDALLDRIDEKVREL